MTWSILLNGHDNLNAGEKENLENIIVGKAIEVFESLKIQDGIVVSTASVSTNTFGSVNLLDENAELPGGRSPKPGEYADPQPASVDVAGDELGNPVSDG